MLIFLYRHKLRKRGDRFVFFGFWTFINVHFQFAEKLSEKKNKNSESSLSTFYININFHNLYLFNFIFLNACSRNFIIHVRKHIKIYFFFIKNTFNFIKQIFFIIYHFIKIYKYCIYIILSHKEYIIC